MFFEVRLKWLSKFKQPFQMEAAGLQRYWTLTLLTLSYLVGTFLPSYYIPSIFLCVLGTILGSFFAAFFSSTSLNVIQVGELGHFLLGSTSRDMAR